MCAFSLLHAISVIIASLLVTSTPVAESFQAQASSFMIMRRTSSSSLLAIADLPARYTEEEKGKQEKKKPKHGRDVVLRIESIPEYKKIVVDEKEHITIVRFYARWCKMCRASEPLFYKLAADFYDKNVKFVEVPLNKNTAVLHEALEVPSLPWTHIYHPDAGLVEERKVNKKHIADVRKCLRCYVYGECDMADEPANCMNLYGECDLDFEDPANW